MINGVFIDGTGATLLSIRRLIDKTTKKHFPLEDLMQAEIKKPLKIEDDQVQEILDIRYGDPRIVPLFSELEHVATRPNDQVDHIWARAILSSKKEIRKLYPAIIDADIEKYKSQLNRLANLQLLDSVVNNEKDNTPFNEWLDTKFPKETERQDYMRMHFIPENQSNNFEDFFSFIDARETLLKRKIKEAFPSDFNKLVTKYNLADKLD